VETLLRVNPKKFAQSLQLLGDEVEAAAADTSFSSFSPLDASITEQSLQSYVPPPSHSSILKYVTGAGGSPYTFAQRGRSARQSASEGLTPSR